MSEPRSFDKTSEAIALEQIASATGYVVPESQVILGTPRVLDPLPGNLTDENTFVPAKINEVFDARYEGENGFLYRRLSIAELALATPTAFAPLSFPYTIHEILPHINALLGTRLTEEEVVDYEILDEDTPVWLEPIESSLAWIGRKSIDIHAPLDQFLVPDPFLVGAFAEYVPPFQAELSDILIDPDLNGFDVNDVDVPN